MAEKPKNQENHFDLHECFESIEELELEMSRLVDATMELKHVVEDSKLPHNLRIGFLYSMVHMIEEDHDKEFSHYVHLKMLSDLLGGHDE